ncbi:MAG: tetratricopeptide repeat protein [Planctomycetota bacterium]
MPSSKSETAKTAPLPLGGRTPAGLLAALFLVPLFCHPDFTAFAPPKTFVLLASIGVATILAALSGLRLARREPLFWIGGLWTVWQAAHLPFVTDPIRGGVTVASGAAAWLVALLFARSYPAGRVPQRPLGLSLTVAAFVSAVALSQVLGLDFIGLQSSGPSELEPVGTLGNTNHLSEYLVPILLTGIVIIAVLPSGFYQIVAAASTLFIAGAIGAAQARAAAISLGAGVFAMTLVWIRFRWSRPKPERRLAMVLVSLAGIAAMVVAGWILDPGAGTARVRILVWQRSLELFTREPLTGVGPGQFLVEFPTVRDPEEIALSSPDRTIDTVVSTPHNELVSALVEAGLPGAVLLLAAFGFAIRRLWTFLGTSPPRQEAWLALGVLAALVAVGTNAMFSSPLTRNPSSLVVTAALVGCAFAISKIPERPTREPAPKPMRAAGCLLGLLLLAGGVWGLTAQIQAARAWSADRDGELEVAIDRLESALALDPSDSRARTRLAHLLAGLGRLGEAIAQQEKVTEWRPNSPSAWLTLGAFEAQAERRESAAASLKRALELDDGDPRAHANIARLVRLELGPADAHPYLLRAAKLSERYVAELRSWGKLLAESGDLENAARYLDSYLQLAPADADAWIDLSQVMREQDDLEAADRFSTRGHFLYGKQYWREASQSTESGLAAEATEQLRQADRQLRIATRFDHLDACLYLVAVQLRRGEREKALGTARRARDIGGDKALKTAKAEADLESIVQDAEIRKILAGG